MYFDYPKCFQFVKKQQKNNRTEKFIILTRFIWSLVATTSAQKHPKIHQRGWKLANVTKYEVDKTSKETYYTFLFFSLFFSVLFRFLGARS